MGIPMPTGVMPVTFFYFFTFLLFYFIILFYSGGFGKMGKDGKNKKDKKDKKDKKGKFVKKNKLDPNTHNGSWYQQFYNQIQPHELQPLQQWFQMVKKKKKK